MTKSITINTVSQILGKAASIFLGIIVTLILRRHLGRSLYGDYVYVITLTTMFSTFADFGTHLVGVKEVSQDKKNQAQIIGNLIFLRFLFSLAAVFLLSCLAFIPSFSNSLAKALILAGFLVFSLSLKNSLVIIFHSQLKLYFFSLLSFLVSLLAVLGVAIFVFVSQTKQVSFYVFVLGLANFVAVLSFLPLAWQTMRPKFKISLKILKRLISQTAPMAGILLLFTLYSKINTVILKLYQSSEAVGIYGLAHKVYENLNVLAAYLMNSLLPVFSSLAVLAGPRKKFKNLFQQVFNILFSAGFLLALLTFIFSPLAVKILTGKILGPEIICLRILSLATFVSFLNHLLGYSIIALGQQLKSFFVSLIALSFNLLANLVFIPLYSFKAAAVNTVLTESLVMFLSFLIVYKKLTWLPNLTSLPKTMKRVFKIKRKDF